MEQKQGEDPQLKRLQQEHERLMQDLSRLNKELSAHDLDSMHELTELRSKFEDRIERLNREKDSEYQRLEGKLEEEKKSLQKSIDNTSQQIERAEDDMRRHGG